LVLLHEVDQRHDGGDEKVDSEEKGGIVGKGDDAVEHEKTACDENDHVENISDERGCRMELPHGFVGILAGVDECGVAFFKLFFFFFGVGEGFGHADALNRAFKGCVDLGN